VPINGFPVCKPILPFLHLKPNGEMKFNALEEFKKQLKQMKDNLDNLTSIVELSDEIVTEHCEMVKNQIETRTESLIQKIENYREVLLKKIDNNAIECKNNTKKEKENFKEKIKKSSELFDEYTDYLNKQNIDENVLIQMNKNAIKQTEAFEEDINKFNAAIFNNNKIKFNECEQDDIDSSKIGRIVYESLVSFDPIKWPNTIDLKSKVSSLSSILKSLILDDGNIVLIYMDTSFNYNICLF
jgi:hypothetical protein